MLGNKVLFLLLAVSSSYGHLGRGLLGGILSSVHDTIHGEVNKVVSTASNVLAHGANFNVEGQVDVNQQTGHRPISPPKETVVVEVEVVDQPTTHGQGRPPQYPNQNGFPRPNMGHNYNRPGVNYGHGNQQPGFNQQHNGYGQGGYGGQNYNGYGGQNNGYRPHNNGYGGPNNGNRPNNNGYGQHNNGYGHNMNGYGGQNNPQYGGQNNNGYGQNNNGYGGTNNNAYGGQNNNGYGGHHSNENGHGQTTNGYGGQNNNGNDEQHHNEHGQSGQGYNEQNNGFGQNNNGFSGQNSNGQKPIPNIPPNFNNPMPDSNNNNNGNHEQHHSENGQTNEGYDEQNSGFGQNNNGFSGQNSNGQKPIPNIPPNFNNPRPDDNNDYKPSQLPNENGYQRPSSTTVKPTTTKPNDNRPLFVPLSPNDYNYGGDKITVNDPKRDTSEDQPAENPEDEFPIDIRFQDE